MRKDYFDIQEGLAVALGPLRQQRRLPVTGRRDRHDRTGISPRQPFDQRRTADGPAPHQRAYELRRDKIESRPAHILRPAGLLSHVAAYHALGGPRTGPRP